jgi:hypothetical protein
MITEPVGRGLTQSVYPQAAQVTGGWWGNGAAHREQKRAVTVTAPPEQSSAPDRTGPAVRYLRPPEPFWSPDVSEADRAAMNASWGTSTRPTIFMRFLPSFCFSSSFRFRVMSPP